MRARCGDGLGAKWPWVCCSFAFPCSLMELTRPTLSPVKRVCKVFSFLSSVSCSSSRRSASSLLSYSPSVSDSDERGEAGRNVVWSRLWFRRVRTEEEEGRFAREGELLLSEFRRARTPSGVVRRMDVDSFERLSLRPPPEILRGKLGRSPASSGEPSSFGGPSFVACGLKEPLTT
jgi:hypothetical protein